MLWEHFNGAIPEKLDIDHFDNNPNNNLISNLRLSTTKDNCSKRKKTKVNILNKINPTFPHFFLLFITTKKNYINMFMVFIISSN
jgi:hypothetical protein